MATKIVLACSHSRSLQLLARLDARTEFKILEPSPKGGVEAGRAHHCSKPATSSEEKKIWFTRLINRLGEKVRSGLDAEYQSTVVVVVVFHIP
jgi:hypothetical protein